jgi:hypothetical protein
MRKHQRSVDRNMHHQGCSDIEPRGNAAICTSLHCTVAFILCNILCSLRWIVRTDDQIKSQQSFRYSLVTCDRPLVIGVPPGHIQQEADGIRSPTGAALHIEPR